MTKGINVKNFNVNYNNGAAKFVRFHAATTSLMKHYVTPTLRTDQLETVIIMCGSNDLPTPRENPTSVESIAETIIPIGELCKFYGVKNIFISSVLTREINYMDRRRGELNNLLKEKCMIYTYGYIDNDNIGHEHLYDKVHLNKDGAVILSDNFLHILNNLEFSSYTD